MKFVFWATLKGSKVSISSLCFASLLFSFVFLATFDAFGDMFFEMIETMPQGFRALVKASGEYASEEMGYLAGGFREPIYLIIINRLFSQVCQNLHLIPTNEIEI